MGIENVGQSPPRFVVGRRLARWGLSNLNLSIKKKQVSSLWKCSFAVLHPDEDSFYLLPATEGLADDQRDQIRDLARHELERLAS